MQLSPLVPGSASLEDLAPASAAGMIIAAPPATAERRRVLALALRALRPGGAADRHGRQGEGRLAPVQGAAGLRLRRRGGRPPPPAHLPHAAPRERPSGSTRPSPAGGCNASTRSACGPSPACSAGTGSIRAAALLIAALPALSGAGADLGCGVGLLAQRGAGPAQGDERLDLVDIDRRAVEAARRNIDDPRARFHWADARIAPLLDGLDFVVMNPPFHDGGVEDKALGQAFIRRAHQVLRKGGRLWLVANRAPALRGRADGRVQAR